MPWSGASFGQKHNHSLRGERADHAARIANATLRSGVGEGEAIRIANKWAKRHRAPGGAAPTVPAMQTGAPNVNLQGYVPVAQGTNTINLDLTSGAMSPNSLPALQGLAQRGLPIANPTFNYGGIADGGAVPRRAMGGVSPMPMSMAMPPWTRGEARGEEAHPSGLIMGMGGGRQDNIPMNLAPHSHVIPADVVSGWGQGNPEQGAANIEHAMKSGPFGMALPKVPTHAAKSMAPRMPRLALGGGNAKGVRTLVSPKEMIISPADVARIGGGDYENGHDWLDRFIVHSRKQIVRHNSSLPGPVKE